MRESAKAARWVCETSVEALDVYVTVDGENCEKTKN